MFIAAANEHSAGADCQQRERGRLRDNRSAELAGGVGGEVVEAAGCAADGELVVDVQKAEGEAAAGGGRARGLSHKGVESVEDQAPGVGDIAAQDRAGIGILDAGDVSAANGADEEIDRTADALAGALELEEAGSERLVEQAGE